MAAPANRLRYGIILAMLAILAVSSYQLFRLPLWGHWCLPWFLAVWILIVSVRHKRFFYDGNAQNLLGWSTISGLCLFLGFPTMPLTFLLFIAFIPLLWIIHLIHHDQRSQKGRRVLFYSFHTFFLWNVMSTFWVANTAFVAGVFAIGLNSFFMAGVVWIFYKIHHHFTQSFSYWILAGLWISFEYLHLHWEIAWPWLNLGNAFAQRPGWIQWYEITGAFGGTLWVWMMNISLYVIFIKWMSQERIRWSQGVFPLLIFSLPIIYSQFLSSRYHAEGVDFQIVAVQPNFEPHHEKFNIPYSLQKDRFLELSIQCLTEDTDLLLFPETSFGFFDVDYMNSYPLVNDLYNLLIRYPQTQLISGISSYRLYDEEHIPPGKDLYKRPQRDGSVVYMEPQNSAVLFRPNKTYEVYLKGKLVPGAEIFPYKKFLPFLTPLVNKLGGSLSDWGSQEQRSTFDVNGVQVAPVICYESVFGEYVGEYIKQGANLLAVVTNDGWWDNTFGHEQHALFARLRAIEYRRPVVRSANMGWTCFIDPLGKISQQNEYGVMGCIHEEIRVTSQITTYAQWGDLIARVSCFLSGLVLLGAWMKRYRK